jgi:hypothetical protein
MTSGSNNSNNMHLHYNSITMVQIKFALLYHLIKAKMSSLRHSNELNISTRSRQSNDISLSLQTAYKLHPDCKCINFGKNMWLVFRLYGKLINIQNNFVFQHPVALMYHSIHSLLSLMQLCGNAK